MPYFDYSMNIPNELAGMSGGIVLCCRALLANAVVPPRLPKLILEIVGATITAHYVGPVVVEMRPNLTTHADIAYFGTGLSWAVLVIVVRMQFTSAARQVLAKIIAPPESGTSPPARTQASAIEPSGSVKPKAPRKKAKKPNNTPAKEGETI